MHVLYYTPGTCSISPHIALREAGLEFELVKVDLRAKTIAGDGDYRTVNPMGYVPALRLPDGQVLTEAAVMVQYIADQVPGRLAPPAGTMERYRLMEWLSFIATELHKGMSPLYNTLANEDYKAHVRQRIAKRLAHLAAAVRDQPYLTGAPFTIGDGYAFYVLRAWQRTVKQDLSAWPELAVYYARLAARPCVVAALAAEGITA